MGNTRSWRELAPLAPAILLCIIAVAQLRLTRTEHLTPWKGGGFGMFSTNDDGLSRPMGIRISGPDGDREITIPASLSRQAYEASMLPSRHRLIRLGREIATLERAEGASVSRVRLAVWRLSYDPRTLAPRPVLVRDFLVDIPEPAR
jgi:hypothetical protein